MEQILEYNGLKLIKKYDRYYIHFIGGIHMEIPCELLITNREAMDIISDNTQIKAVMNGYKSKIVWDLSYFIDSAIRDYMFYECNMSEKRIEKDMIKLNRHEDIKMEFYETIMYESFPVNSPIKVEDYTAQQLNETTHLTVMGVYNYLIYLREDPKTALDNLKKELLIK